MRQRRREDHADAGAHDRGQLLAVGLPRRHRGALLRRRRLEQIRRRRPDFAAARETLNQPGDDQQDRRSDADLRIRRRQRHDAGSERHQQQRERQRGTASDAIRVWADDGRAERPGDKPNAEGGQRAKQPADLRFGREEGVADHHGEEGEDQEVVELEPVADDDRDDRFHRQNWLDA